MATSNPASQNQQTAIILGYLRIWQIVGDRKRGIEPLLPVGRSTFLAGVKSGKYPKPVKLGKRTTAWKKADILALLDSVDGAA
ncbi:helix-turn-helix transcriptional regulator [Methylomonas koyamae]|uniref:helix-turn-helix transcriptional regulator n=1 Tax=Methylomonas koyamae TaxID=702114 RepID=UPI00112E1B59|nr:AlpA family phage regulatory protein [Methylomonas koyamae]TPQ24335.1 AlpA family transcriptional regulator [Methylomonas koyamae]